MNDEISPAYKLVQPLEFTDSHHDHLEKLKESISLLSEQTKLIFGAKDIHSRHISSTDSYANLVGLRFGSDVGGRLDEEMPCEGTAEFADSFVREDQALLQLKDISQRSSILNVHNYTDGLKALVFDKYIFKHVPSRSILGVIYSAYEIDLKNFFTVIPNYVMEFGGGSIEAANGGVFMDNIHFSEYEHEICFLLVMGWESNQIADFLNKYRPKEPKRTADTIYKSKNRLCEKLNLPSGDVKKLKEKLISIGMHRRMPQAFFSRMVGSSPIKNG
ncbi:hypothetical protein [Chitinimonas sp. BJB300]|uniref:hypothetical protein n=1 Tax=Chitinimonas sp. BJB300 TaxID=1559339 RepID=UPI000C1008AA|nr:hypothetical protein [Chitinimonas sp. BJB300]PHV11917.1 hypothetical protein CSQ89_08320 [Chitinimonas sp. BJB300]TSJ84456.1 hypothetical protein FG002_020125 [Chitinimonas sp. BJB300]